MKQKVFISFLISVFLNGNGFSQHSQTIREALTRVADRILTESSFHILNEQTKVPYTIYDTIHDTAHITLASPHNDWRYWNGVLTIAMIRLAEQTKEQRYKEFALKNITFMFNAVQYFQKRYRNENKWAYPLAQYFVMEELDDCGAMGAAVLEVYKNEQQPRYWHYIERAAEHILQKQTRLQDGTFVRSFPVRWTLWADDLYMSVVFLARMGEYTRKQIYFHTAVQQVINFHKYLTCSDGVMVHNWYSDTNQKGVAKWGRANGWALLAQIDLLERLPRKHPMYKELVHLFRMHVYGIIRYQGPNGLWHQLIDKMDSYEETSCSAMFTYTIAKAITLGIIPKRYSSVAYRGWEGIATKIANDGTVHGVCTGTVVSDNLVDYYRRPTPLNDVHGLGTVLLAGYGILEMIEKGKER
ncbi:MAG: glycoside hydrolase family 88 protein [Bacteroidetes bacterium]|nr:glycoside hydrolase family 88 protein [Bacteroidota bacterium]